MEFGKVPKLELDQRMEQFLAEMCISHDNWEVAAITGAAGMFYLTGTICDGVLLIRRGIEATLWVRRSYERSIMESEFSDIRQMNSFRNVAEAVGALDSDVYLDTAHASLEWYSMLTKYLPFKQAHSLDKTLLNVRAVKSEYELERMRLAGDKINQMLTQELPSLISDNISEAVLGAHLLAKFIENDHHGISRSNMRNASELLGHIAFGDGVLYPGVFNGASGIAGLYPAAPALGRRDRFLCSGDLIYIDVCFGIDGYHVDKTMVYSYLLSQTDEIRSAHKLCLDLELHAASLLRPGALPSMIYEEIYGMVSAEHIKGFMGTPGRTVPFLGHSIGLSIDETPVLAMGFDSPLEKNMTIAIEPKIGIEGIGMVGSENTYLVTENGGVSLTGTPKEILVLA
ncbi:MAG: M24 family metallopeptidase [Oscillospiraceae bacterium]|nr:M24 family metallopeptidase [Oscillospiraceae bacterium]